MPPLTKRQFYVLLEFAERSTRLFRFLVRDRVTPLTPEQARHGRQTLAIGWRLLSGTGARPKLRVPARDPLPRGTLFAGLVDVSSQLRAHFNIPPNDVANKPSTYSGPFDLD